MTYQTKYHIEIYFENSDKPRTFLISKYETAKYVMRLHNLDGSLTYFNLDKIIQFNVRAISEPSIDDDYLDATAPDN